MKLSLALLAFFGSSLVTQTLALDKTQEQAQKFLLDEGEITDKAEVQSFYIDRQGNVRINLIQDGKKLGYGLQEDGDTYSISYMSKKKHYPKPTQADRNAELEKLIGEKMSILKGGKVISVKEDAQNRKKLLVEYEIDGKSYNIEGYQDRKRGEFSMSKVIQISKEQTL